MMKLGLFAVVLLMCFCSLVQAQEKKAVYLLPGQGSDCRIFSKLNIDTAQYSVYCLKYGAPRPDESMKDFSMRISKAIDTSQQFILIGVSLGGMISTEIAHHLHPEKVILISSAKTRKELPKRYLIQRSVQSYRIIPKRAIKAGALLLQPIVEPDRRKEKATFVDMLKSKSPNYFKETVRVIVEWERQQNNANNIIHIHGSTDHTIPLRNVSADYIVSAGSHMMTLTQPAVINFIINKILND